MRATIKKIIIHRRDLCLWKRTRCDKEIHTFVRGFLENPLYRYDFDAGLIVAPIINHVSTEVA